jgi:hypothetical protein
MPPLQKRDQVHQRHPWLAGRCLVPYSQWQPSLPWHHSRAASQAGLARKAKGYGKNEQARFARHVDPSTTSIYISTSKQEVYDVIDAMAVEEVAALKKRVGR